VISPLDYNVSSQFAHFFTAAFLVSQLGRIGHGTLFDAAFGMLVFAAVKEFWYDYKYETPDVRGSSLLDFSMYCAGTLVAVGLSLI
jgi:hypothetical protein